MKSLIPKGAKSTFDENWVIDIRTLFTSVPVFQQKYLPKLWEHYEQMHLFISLFHRRVYKIWWTNSLFSQVTKMDLAPLGIKLFIYTAQPSVINLMPLHKGILIGKVWNYCLNLEGVSKFIDHYFFSFQQFFPHIPFLFTTFHRAPGFWNGNAVLHEKNSYYDVVIVQTFEKNIWIGDLDMLSFVHVSRSL